MIIETVVKGKPRKKVFCVLEEIKETGSNIYSFVNLPNEALGDGSEVVVINSPGKLLFYCAADGLLYDWSV